MYVARNKHYLNNTLQDTKQQHYILLIDITSGPNTILFTCRKFWQYNALIPSGTSLQNTSFTN